MSENASGQVQLSDAWTFSQIRLLKDSKHTETYNFLKNNPDKIYFKSYVTDGRGNVKWYDLGKYDPSGKPLERKFPNHKQ